MPFGYMWHEECESSLRLATGGVMGQSPSIPILNWVHVRAVSCDPPLPQFLYKMVIEAAKVMTMQGTASWQYV